MPHGTSLVVLRLESCRETAGDCPFAEWQIEAIPNNDLRQKSVIAHPRNLKCENCLPRQGKQTAGFANKTIPTKQIINDLGHVIKAAYFESRSFALRRTSTNALIWDSVCVIKCDAVAINLVTEESECLWFCTLRMRWMQEARCVALERKIVVADSSRRVHLAVPHLHPPGRRTRCRVPTL
jgi:hypothetical protein